MPLGTIERKPPAFFKHGMSSLSKLVVFSILSVVLMVADVRYGVTQPLRATISLMLYPMEWLSMRPQWLFDVAGRFFEGRDDAQAQVQAMTLKLQQQALRSGQVEQLALENLQLRRLLELRERLTSSTLAAEVLYDSADPFTRKVVIDKGALQGVQPSSPVMDDAGVLGQVTCATWRPMPILRWVTCSPPVGWMPFIPRVCQWRWWSRWSGVRSRCLRVSCASRKGVCRARAM